MSGRAPIAFDLPIRRIDWSKATGQKRLVKTVPAVARRAPGGSARRADPKESLNAPLLGSVHEQLRIDPLTGAESPDRPAGQGRWADFGEERAISSLKLPNAHQSLVAEIAIAVTPAPTHPPTHTRTHTYRPAPRARADERVHCGRRPGAH